MGFFKLKKRCKFCAHVLRADGTCQNPNCIDYTEEPTKESTDKKEADSTAAQ